MKVDIPTSIALPPEAVWAAVQTPELLQHIAAPLIRFTPSRGSDWPGHFVDDAPVAANLWLLGVIPLGRQWIVPSLHPPESSAWPQRLRDNGHSRMIRRWDHWITVEPDETGGTFYRDSVEVDAGILTPIIGLFAHAFYRHRQLRWRGLADRLPVYRLIWEERAIFKRARAKGETEVAWEALKMAHILAQPYLGPHWSSHIAMLGFAAEQRDWREVGGQLLRLALVPLGNATGRLPVGNHGRARVSPFRPMPIPNELRTRLAATGTALPTNGNHDTA